MGFNSAFKGLNTSVVKFPMEMKKIFKEQVAKFTQILGILKNTFQPNLVQKSS